MPRPIETTTAYTNAAVKLRRMVSLSPAFQRECGVSSDVEALQRIHLRGRQIRDKAPTPFALIQVGNLRRGMYAGGVKNWLKASGSLRASIKLNVADDLLDDLIGAELYASNFFGTVFDEVAKMAAEDDPGSGDEFGHLAITQMELEFDINDDKLWVTEGIYHFAFLHVMWEGGS